MHTFNFNKITRHAPLLAAISGSLLVMALGIDLLCVPMYKSILVQQKEYTYYQSRISSESDYGDLKQDILQKIVTLEAITSQNKKETPTADISSYLEYLITLGKQSNISFVRMQPQEEEKGATSSLHPILLVLTSTYNDCGRFIASIEKLPHLYRVERIALDATENGKCNVKLLLACRIPREADNDK